MENKNNPHLKGLPPLEDILKKANVIENTENKTTPEQNSPQTQEKQPTAPETTPPQDNEPWPERRKPNYKQIALVAGAAILAGILYADKHYGFLPDPISWQKFVNRLHGTDSANSESESARNTKYVRYYASSPLQVIDYVVNNDGIWRAPKDIKDSDKITKVSVVVPERVLDGYEVRKTLDGRIENDLNKLITIAQENDSRYWSPKEMAAVIEALPYLDNSGSKEEITLKDIEKGFELMGAKGGLKEILSAKTYEGDKK
ncbi:MAG: hypothetical protein EPN86_03505 [Nanoarchaeota archaeon]|nr:MAG: hypothetical protein EPN86_03505 [Nanoarchaeota archaeon]